MNMSKLPDYKTYAKHDWDIKKAQAAFFPKSPNLWFAHICDSVVSPVSIRMIPMFMIFTLALGLSIATTWCVIDMIFTDNTKLKLWFMAASVLSICVTKFVHKVGRRLYQRQKVSFGYFWYLVGFSAYLNLRKEENFDDNVIDLENDDNAIDYTEDELESAQVMVDMGICTGTRFGLPHTPKEIMEILIQNDDRYFDRGDTIIADLQPIFDQVENEFILDIDKIRAAGEEAYEQFIKDLKNGKATPEHSCIMMG